MARRSTTAKARVKRKRDPSRTARGKRRFGALRGVAATLAVLILAAFLYLYVSVTSRFGDGTWAIPSKVWSDVTALGPGAPVSIDALETRLVAASYAETRGAPSRPGEYRRRGEQIEVFRRGYEAPGLADEARRFTVTFGEERVRAVRGADGRTVRTVVLEPVLLATLYGPRQEERQLLELSEMPEPFLEAVLAAEDSRYYRHHGLDLRGILRAAWANLTHGRIVQGGSTITQQTIKNLYLGQQRTWWRKLREMAMALALDARFDKDEILEVYLNEVYLGQSGPVAICGAEAAARFYFGQSLADLTLGEWALLAGMIRSPGGHNPFTQRDAALERRRQVLEAMARLDFIDEAASEAAASEPLRLARGARGGALAPYAVDFVQASLGQQYPRSVLAASGLQIYTTIDPAAQTRAEAALVRGLERLERGHPAVRRQAAERSLQGAVVVTRPSSGAILALVGGRDHAASQFNRAVQARRQPGSCFKPFVFAAGLDRAQRGEHDGLTAATVLEDVPFELVSGGESWSPANYDKTFRGTVNVREALEGSLNVPTVRAAQRVGLANVVATARACGIESPMSPLPSLALGTAEVAPLELATAYGVFSNGGLRVPPRIIRAVTDGDGEVLDGPGGGGERVLSAETAWLMGDLLHGVFERGTARSAAGLGFAGTAAGKTGTTDDTRDAWFVGYTDDLLALVWIGYDDNARTGLTGATGALPIWVEIMREAGESAPLRLAAPRGIVERKIDVESGELAVSGCVRVARESFARGTEPRETCSVHKAGFKQWLRRLFGGKGRRGDGVPGV